MIYRSKPRRWSWSDQHRHDVDTFNHCECDGLYSSSGPKVRFVWRILKIQTNYCLLMALWALYSCLRGGCKLLIPSEPPVVVIKYWRNEFGSARREIAHGDEGTISSVWSAPLALLSYLDTGFHIYIWVINITSLSKPLIFFIWDSAGVLIRRRKEELLNHDNTDQATAEMAYWVTVRGPLILLHCGANTK